MQRAKEELMAKGNEREQARAKAEAWVRERGRRLGLPRKRLAGHLRLRDEAVHLTDDDIAELVELAVRLGNGVRTREQHFAVSDALRFVREEGVNERNLRAELKKRWPALEESEVERLLLMAEHYQFRAAVQRPRRERASA
jgi:hypothetical protein